MAERVRSDLIANTKADDVTHSAAALHAIQQCRWLRSSVHHNANSAIPASYVNIDITLNSETHHNKSAIGLSFKSTPLILAQGRACTHS